MDKHGQFPPTSGTNVEASPKTSKFCAKFSLAFDRENPYFDCGICHRRVHVSCTAGKYNEQEISKLERNTTPFFFKGACALDFNMDLLNYE